MVEQLFFFSLKKPNQFFSFLAKKTGCRTGRGTRASASTRRDAACATRWCRCAGGRPTAPARRVRPASSGRRRRPTPPAAASAPTATPASPAAAAGASRPARPVGSSPTSAPAPATTSTNSSDRCLLLDIFFFFF